MKKIPDELKSDIEDAATAGLLGNLPAVVAEKDQHITDTLRVLAQIQITHIARQIDRRKGDTKPASIMLATQLIFAGGTCLSKAYGDVSGVLRPQLKLELIHRPPMLAAETREMGYMLDQFVPREAPNRFSMTCITVAETLAEKVLSLLRRCAWHWDGNQRGEFDTALVRHVYDVWRIAGSQPDAMEAACQIFGALVQKDVEEFKGQHPEFDQAPYRVLRRSLVSAATDEGLKANFEQRLKPLLYAADKPDFQTCYVVFAAVAERLLNHAA
ncbi:nucleotidyl transferase AbiEii/AbiGii toxin family protein [Pseudomonas corrugata]|uniref:nucleotidyl transferase AbiEii/AbiGii toxin family protein n=1 Tax=Pseudomonas corrugata TaxID=47879 RepID=UPI0006D8C5B8|nr:nucleotidyl transferase AbiEii/AbiGii toxin family protein [Pseudomonas corrugata]AOE61958.1 inorganic pyrophosphatase/exopolyphosphatase [Pseudomonas corrugata]